jgi:CBS domain-containing protein
MSVLEIGKTDLVVAYPDELLHDAVAKMLKRDIGRLPVVSRDEPNRVIGYVGRADVLNARMRLHEEEEARGRGPVANKLTAITAAVPRFEKS